MTAGPSPIITVQNTLGCERGGYIAVQKTIINTTKAGLTGMNFPVVLTCVDNAGFSHPNAFNLTLTSPHPGVDQRKLDIMQRGRPCKKIKSLENKSDLFVADPGKLVVGHVGNKMAVDPVVAF